MPNHPGRKPLTIFLVFVAIAIVAFIGIWIITSISFATAPGAPRSFRIVGGLSAIPGVAIGLAMLVGLVYKMKQLKNAPEPPVPMPPSSPPGSHTITVHMPPLPQRRLPECPGCGSRKIKHDGHCMYCGGLVPFEPVATA